MDLITHLIDLFLHLDTYLASIISQYGAWTYGLLFFVIFIETGFVVTPFLPGDSLLFAAGAFASPVTGEALNVYVLVGLLTVAAVLGDTANYWIGHFVGERAYGSRWVKKEYIDRTHAFFQKHGGKTFVAGVGKMSYGYFFSYNVVGGMVWVPLLTLSGYFFGTLPFVQKNFEFVIIAIILISLIPVFLEAWKARQEGAKEKIEVETP